MNYLKVETNNLVDLAGRNEKNLIDWNRIGTNPKSINLSPIRNQIKNINTEVTITMIPIVEESKANEFIQECENYGVKAEIITQTQVEKVLSDNKPVD